MAKKISACPGWLGLSDDRTSFVFLPERADIVKKIFELSIGGLGGFTIAKHLNAQGVPAFGPSSKWDQSTIHNMLRNRATFGEHQPKRYQNNKEFLVGEPVPDYYPPVIEKSLFDAAQVARQKNLASGRGRKGRHITNLFAGIPVCAYCGGPIKFHSNGHAKSLICSTVLEGRGCHRMAWSYRNFEDSFFELILKSKSDQSIEQQPDWDALDELANHIDQLSGPDLHGARTELSVSLRANVSELLIGSAGLKPIERDSRARIRRDGPGRYFEVRLQGGDKRTGLPSK